MPVNKESVENSIVELTKTCKLMGDGQFEPLHWAGDPVLSKVLTELASVKAIEGQGMMIGMLSMVKLMLTKKEDKNEDKNEDSVKTMLSESASHTALVFLAGYRLGRKEAEIDQLERMM